MYSILKKLYMINVLFNHKTCFQIVFNFTKQFLNFFKHGISKVV